VLPEGFFFFEDESIGFANTGGEVVGGDKRKTTRSGNTRVCGTAGIKHARCLGQASGGEKATAASSSPLVFTRGLKCLTQEDRIMESKMLCLKDKGEEGRDCPVLPPNQNCLLPALALSYHQTLGDILWPEDTSLCWKTSPWCPALVQLGRPVGGADLRQEDTWWG